MCYAMSMARNKEALNLYIDPAILARLEAWLARQELPTTKTAVVELALREFLDKRERKR
jgi:hypothetical protein